MFERGARWHKKNTNRRARDVLTWVAVQGAVQDTTGAGDAFIGTVLYAITHGLSLEKMLQLAALVAASSCTGLGSRPALPHAHQISQELLIP